MPSERRLFGATVMFGTLVLLSHAGGPTSCAARHIEARSLPPNAFSADVELGLVLVAKSGERVVLEPGTDVEFNSMSGVFLVGYRISTQSVVYSPDAKYLDEMPAENIRSVTVVGGSRAGSGAGYGALFGGLTGAGVGLALNGSGLGGGVIPVCAVGFGAAGTGVGAIGGGASGHSRTEYVIGDWRIIAPKAPAPETAAPKTPAATSVTAPQPPTNPQPSTTPQPSVPPPVVPTASPP